MFLRPLTKPEVEAKTIEDFIEIYAQYKDLNLQEGIHFTKESTFHSGVKKLKPSIHIAKPNESREITEIFKEVYRGTYPYKELEDEEEIRNMIEDPFFHWIVFKIPPNEIVGCGAYHIDHYTKCGTFHAIAIKKAYQGKLDTIEPGFALMASVFNAHKGEVLNWSCEVRTSHSKSQFMLKNLGLIPIAFLPNKDIFYNRKESDFLYIIYDKEVFQKYRCSKTPNIIIQASFCYYYAHTKYGLGMPNFESPKINLNSQEIEEIKNNLIKRIESDKFEVKRVFISIKNRDSFIEYIYRPNINIFEQVIYSVKTKEELQVFIDEIKESAIRLRVHYIEILVSAYEAVHQKIIYRAGFKPAGYIPAWMYDSKLKKFEDRLIFVFYTGLISSNIQLISETTKFLKMIKFYKRIKSSKIIEPF